MTLLDVRHLTKSFDGNRVVDGVSFSVAAGEIVGLIGPNGAGKSTCFNMINGQLRPDAGEVWFDGRRIDGRGAIAVWHAGIGRSFQVAAVFGSLSVIDNVRAAVLSRQRKVWRFFHRARRYGTGDSLALLRHVGLEEAADLGASMLAYGDVKRLELALALANQPRLLLLDEPTAGMTQADRRGVADLLAELVQRTGCAVVLTEHDTDMVFRLATRVLVMDKGGLIAEGAPASVRADPSVRRAYLGE